MSGFRKPTRRWWGWLVAITYLLGSLSPSLAVPLPANLAELGAQRAHEAYHEHAQKHQHSHDHRHSQSEHQHVRGDAKVAVDSHHECTPVLGHGDHSPYDQRGNCCGSILCFSAVSPQAPSLLRFAPLQSRCESEPDSVRVVEALGPLYRPPIA